MDFRLNLRTETIERLFSIPPVLIGPETPLREVLQILAEHDTGSVLIVRDEVLVGIFTEWDALHRMTKDMDLDHPVETVMTPNPVTISREDTVATAIRKMSEGGYRRLPCVDEAGHPVGIVRVSNVLHYLAEHFPQVVYNLPPASHNQPPSREGA